MVEYLSGERVQGLGEQSSEVLNTMSNQNSNGKLCTNEQYFYGQQIGTGFSGIGEQINRVDFYMQKDGNPTGNAKCTIYTGSVLSGGSVRAADSKGGRYACRVYRAGQHGGAARPSVVY